MSFFIFTLQNLLNVNDSGRKWLTLFGSLSVNRIFLSSYIPASPIRQWQKLMHLLYLQPFKSSGLLNASQPPPSTQKFFSGRTHQNLISQRHIGKYRSLIRKASEILLINLIIKGKKKRGKIAFSFQQLFFTKNNKPTSTSWTLWPRLNILDLSGTTMLWWNDSRKTEIQDGFNQLQQSGWWN